MSFECSFKCQIVEIPDLDEGILDTLPRKESIF